MSKTLIASIVVLLGAGIFVKLFVLLPTAKVTVKVLDEAGNPMPNETVTFSFVDILSSKWGEVNYIQVKATTDASGMASASGYSESRMSCGVKKDGYYEGGPSSIVFKDVVLGRWQPWNSVYPMVLRKILDPIPMYAKRVQINIPAFDQPIGFDLAVGDWVQPFGKGITSDFLFTMFKAQSGVEDYHEKLVLTFANKGDGIQVAPQDLGPGDGWSRLKFPRNAPQDGYVNNWTTEVSYISGSYKEEHANGIGYSFRVRTLKTTKGDIQSTDYGKIDGDISLFETGTAHPGISFIYYFNPTGTTNLEFDPTKNLLNVAPLEAVWNP